MLELWQQEIPGQWKRGIDAQLLDRRYRRGDRYNLHPGEHTIEYQILVERFGKVNILGATWIDGVNAFSLASDFANGGRSGLSVATLLEGIEPLFPFETYAAPLAMISGSNGSPKTTSISLSYGQQFFVHVPV